MTGEDRPITEDQYYQLAVQEDGCHNCGHGTMWTVFYKDEKGEPVEIGQAWGDQDLTQDVCDLMNMAYDRGRETLEPVLKLASELCDAIDAEEADVGGHRRARDILGELGPAVEAAK